jgi:hypothetical protein
MPFLIARVALMLFPFVRPMAQELLRVLYRRHTRMNAEGQPMPDDNNRGQARSFVFTRGPGGTTIISDGAVSLSIKATSALSIVVIWATMIPAIIVEPGGWPALVFAFLATVAVGVSAWRRLGISRLIAISGAWLATALAVGGSSDNWWMGAFAFFSTGAIVYSIMKRDAYLGGIAIAVAWLVTGIIAMDEGGGTAWMSIFAFLTSAVVANAFGKSNRALIAAVAWAIAGVLMLALDGSYWIALIATLASITSFGLGGFNMPRKFEWDLFDRDGNERPGTMR